MAVLVTGASGGIGRAISRACAAAGWFVGVHFFGREAEAQKTLRAVRATGGDGVLCQADIRDAAAVRETIEGFARQVTAPLALICSAGIASSQLVVRQRAEDWDAVVETNLTGTYHCLRAMAPFLAAQGGGSIVVVGSHAGYRGSTGQAAYAASKAGVIGLVKSAAKEWGPENIRINLVLPGWQQTGLSAEAIADRQDWSDHALGRPPAMEDVARTIVHLIQLRDVSGQVWNCDSRDL
jgi:3-oxoacyl-[acyl-carrier protein] reductase